MIQCCPTGEYKQARQYYVQAFSEKECHPAGALELMKLLKAVPPVCIDRPDSNMSRVVSNLGGLK